VAEAMVAYIVAGGHHEVFDPAVGAGAFLIAAKQIQRETGRHLTLGGCEIDPSALTEARASGLSNGDLLNVEITDFLFHPPKRRPTGIVANPPYIRHHRLSEEVKAGLRALAAAAIGRPLDGRAGIHVYFLIRALQMLAPGGRLAFLVPADTCEGVFARPLWHWITTRYRLDAVVTFAREAAPFRGVDTNALILLIANAPPRDTFWWAQCLEPGCSGLKSWIVRDFSGPLAHGLVAQQRDVSEGLRTGLSRPPYLADTSEPTLGDYARVLRGIATGANEFFFLTRAQVAAVRLPDELLVPAVGRTRDVPGETLTPETMDRLEAAGRPTLLFSPDARPMDQFPSAVRDYLEHGAKLGIPERPLIRTRHPWYKMESRRVPHFLFAYLGRRNARFIRNLAGVVPLTCFLCVYPSSDDRAFVDGLWEVLRDPATRENLRLVGKSYGDGAIKVEPRALERLPLPKSVVQRAGLLEMARPTQLDLSGYITGA
jgi:adenine-specific DNA-methyltransferase